MIYLRVGTRLLFIRSTNPQETSQRLTMHLGCREVTLEEGQRESDENSTLLFITPTGLEITDSDDAAYILLAEGSGTAVLSEVINQQLMDDIERIDMGPRILIFRVPEIEDEIIEVLAKDFNARRVTWKEGVRLGEKGQTMLGLTTQRLHQALDEKAVHNQHLLIDQPLNECYAQLRREALLYITHSLKDGSWYEYRINLYDTKENYELHYKRLIQVISGLEMGMILGESWTRDHALALMSVMAYQVRLFSFLKPPEIKKILVGLEYDEKGHRLADFDLYHRNKKVAWTETQKNTVRLGDKRNKKEEGIHLRNELMVKMPVREKDKLLQLEEKLKEKTQ